MGAPIITRLRRFSRRLLGRCAGRVRGMNGCERCCRVRRVCCKDEGWFLMIAVIDYKAGNLTSVVKALNFLGVKTLVTQDPTVVRAASKIVLPGVGHFQATQLLAELGLAEAVRESVGRGAWFLGICVGLQWLFEGSTEAPGVEGLGEFAG